MEQKKLDVYIHGGEMITTHGFLTATWEALLQQKSPKIEDPPGFSQALPLAIIDDLQGSFGSKKRLDSLLGKLFATLPPLPENCCLICATTKGAIDEISATPSPNSGQVWQVTEEIRQQLNISLQADCVSAACASGTIAIMQGAMKILQGECDHALIISFDLMASFVLSGFLSLKALSLTQCRPFDKNRDGLTLGEGAAWILLSKDKASFNRASSSYTLENWGVSCDATHITAPCRHGSGLIRTLQQTTKNSSLQVGAINSHGTGTVYNDSMELLAFNTLWDAPPPMCSIKGSVGHCLGAAGVIETLVSIKSLEEEKLPPTVGLISPEGSGNSFLSGSATQKITYPTILSCNSGFGGINGALLISQL